MVGICGGPLIEQKSRSMNGAQFHVLWVGKAGAGLKKEAAGTICKQHAERF
jgi:hypothetical protein